MIGTGLINGGTNYSEQRENRTLVTSAPEETAGDLLPIIVPTVLQMSRDALAYWQNITCFFNKWWYPDRTRLTLPFCFFHTVKYSEKQSMEASQKRVILYEPPEEDATPGSGRADPVRQGLMQTITDNVVLKPKEYLLEAVVPFMPFGRYSAQSSFVYEHVLPVFLSTEEDTGIAATAKTYISAQFRRAQDMSNAAGGAYSAMSGISNERSPIDSNNMVNKNSLDAMFERGNILEFKTWMGYEKKYVVIVDMTMEKRGAEDDVWRVNMTLREMPILSLTRAADTVQPVVRDWERGATNAVGSAAGVRNAASLVPALDRMEA